MGGKAEPGTTTFLHAFSLFLMRSSPTGTKGEELDGY